MRPTGAAYEKHRENMAARQRDARAKAAEIGPLPEVVEPDRRQRCRESLREFAETYRPEAFSLGWSEDHLRILERFETTVRDGGLFALAMPRGSGKTTITITAALWALLYGFRNWVCLVGATGPKAAALLKSIKTELRFNPLLLQDFPETCHPIARLEGKAIRANAQTLDGVETNIEWLAESLTFPTVAGSPSSGAVVTVAGITGDIRGQQKTLSDGRVIRPDFVIGDDVQTRESAKSRQQTDDRLAIIHGDILGLGGPGVKMSGVFPITVIQRGDVAERLLDTETSPEFHGERTRLLYGMPTNMSLWNKYSEIRDADFRNGGDGSVATEFYRENRADMEVGCRAAWDDRHNPDEISGIQHALNLYFRDEGAFWAEFQNEPIQTAADDLIGEDEITERVHACKRGVVPDEADMVTAFVDVQKQMLFYCVTAWRKDFTGYVIDYGGFPDQQTTNFRYQQAKQTLSKRWPGESLEVTLTRGLNELINGLCGRSWTTPTGTELSIERVLIDANWGLSRNIVYEFARRSQHKAIIFPSHGKGVGASAEPLNAKHVKKAGRSVGLHWRVDKSRDAPNRYVVYDTNHWKSFCFARLGTEPGTSSSLTLYEATPRTHKTFARHLKSEYPVTVEGRGRTVDEWKTRADLADNHWFDCLVGTCVAASVQGCNLTDKTKTIFGSNSAPKRKRKRRNVSF